MKEKTNLKKRKDGEMHGEINDNKDLQLIAHFISKLPCQPLRLHMMVSFILYLVRFCSSKSCKYGFNRFQASFEEIDVRYLLEPVRCMVRPAVVLVRLRCSSAVCRRWSHHHLSQYSTVP